jgi:hypothetical protein
MTAQTDAKPRTWIGTAEAAKLLDAPQRTVGRWADEGKFGAVQRIPVGNGGLLQLNRGRVLRFRDKRTAEARAAAGLEP